MHKIVEEYGKQHIKQLLDRIIISQSISDEWAYNWLLSQKIITRATKTIQVRLRKNNIRKWKDNVGYVDTGDVTWTITMKNGTGYTKFSCMFLESEVPQILEDCND